MTTLEQSTSPRAAALRDRVLVVPVGATEQHGPHLPLTTDTDIAVALAARLSALAPKVVVAPPMSYGASGEHQDFPGTLSIGSPATETVLVELGRSATLTWSRLLLLCAHGGNVAAVDRAVVRLQAEGRDVRGWYPTWKGDAHAGHVETSIMLAIAPERVDCVRAEAGALEPLDVIFPRLRAGGVAAVSANGVLGDPTTADAETGRKLLDDAVAELEELVWDWTWR